VIVAVVTSPSAARTFDVIARSFCTIDGRASDAAVVPAKHAPAQAGDGDP